MDLMSRKTDDRIRHEVLTELEWDSRLDGSDIHVAADHGAVTLTGTVDSYAEKHAAQEAAHRILGVTDVANDLEVKLPEKHLRSDTAIAHAVRHALEWDVMVPDRRIESTVTDGWVTLDGSVDRLREREDAEAAVRQLTGVQGVLNRITVSAPSITVEDVCRTVDHVLAQRAHREASGIDVKIRDGVVSLAGKVHSWDEQQAILRAVGHARGIRAIDNRIRIDPSE
jgi:osmotically-inducible protein OsmY